MPTTLVIGYYLGLLIIGELFKMKKKKEIVVPIVIGILCIPLNIILIVFILIAVSFVRPYKIHRPALLYQTESVFSDSLGNVYFMGTPVTGMYKYLDTSQNKYERVFNDFDDGFCKTAVANDDYIFVLLTTQGQYSKDSIVVLNKSLERIKQFILIDGGNVIDIAEKNNCLYYAIFDYNNNQKNIVLKRVDPFTEKHEFLAESNDNKVVYREDDVVVSACGANPVPGHCIRFSSDKRVFYNGWVDGFNYTVNGESMVFELNGVTFNVNLSFPYDRFYEKKCLLNDSFVFATMEYQKDKHCGSSNGICTCGIGKSYLYSFDFSTKSLTMIKEFKKGTFLIDYGFDDIAYYYEGGFYVNDVFAQTCEIIKEGELETIIGRSVLSSGEEILKIEIK